jgi:hypothetical protein
VAINRYRADFGRPARGGLDNLACESCLGSVAVLLNLSAEVHGSRPEPSGAGLLMAPGRSGKASDSPLHRLQIIDPDLVESEVIQPRRQRPAYAVATSSPCSSPPISPPVMGNLDIRHHDTLGRNMPASLYEGGWA